MQHITEVILPEDRLTLLREVLALPTAPFAEQAVMEYAVRFAETRGLEVHTDDVGNLLLRYRHGRVANGPWVFAAHMDHPGFVARRQRGRTVWADFRGGVQREYFPDARAVFFTPSGQVRGVVESAVKSRQAERPGWLNVKLELNGEAKVPAGSIGMWDFPASRLRGSRLSARACDDLVGVAAVFSVLDKLSSARAHADVIGLLTRAEEVGLCGATAACQHRVLPEASLLVTIETSSAQRAAPLGGGMVIRVGDRVRSFDPAMTAHLVAVANDLASAGGDFRFRRALMPGGVCESSVYQTYGYRTAAVCVPLGNYHNRGRNTRIAPERIDVGDYASLVALLGETAVSGRNPAQSDDDLRVHFERRLDAQREHFA